MWFKKKKPFITLLQACLGILLTGRIGGGKSSFLRVIAGCLADLGAILAISCVKPDEAAIYKKILPSAVLMSGQVWNPFYEQMKNPGGSANLAIMVTDLSEALTRADGQKEESYWKNGKLVLVQNAAELAYHVKGEHASFKDVYEIIRSAPTDLNYAASEAFRSTACAQFISALGNRRPDLAQPYSDYFLRELPANGDKAAGAFVGGALGALRPLVTGPISPLINGKPTITTAEILTGHTIWDQDTLTYGQGGLAYQLLLAWSCQEDVLKRTGDFGYFALFKDEYASLAHARRDSACNQVGRSLKYIPVVAYQNQPLFEAALGGGVEAKTQANALFGLHVNKYMCNQNCRETCELQSETIGREKKMFFGMNIQDRNPDQLQWWDALGVGQSPNISFNQQWHFRLAPTEYQNLRTGGPENNFIVDAILHRGLDGFEYVSVSQR